MTKSAVFDETGKYRYRLLREWDDSKPKCAFLMLNPSTANAEDDDPTIRRCIGFAKEWGYGGVEVVNLFALVSSDPKKLLTDNDPVGKLNDEFIFTAICEAGIVVAAWGAFKESRQRAADVLKMLDGIGIRCLGITKDGCPKHPLYIKGNTLPILMREARHNGS